MRGIFAALIGLLLLTSMDGRRVSAASSSGLTVDLKASETDDDPVLERVRLYGASYALVIGIDSYSNGWPRLSNAVKDAELVADVLERRGFDVTLVRNADAATLSTTLQAFFVLKGEDPEARLFVWYAGHGHTEYGEGFLVPADAPHPQVGASFRLKALSLRRFGEYVRLARSKHAYAVFDSCFSGTIFDSQRALPSSAITRATSLPVRQFLSSGDADQQVSDDGTFRELFLRALSGEGHADANRDGYLTASELGLHLTDRITNLTRSRQTPRYGKLRDSRFDRGDFVFKLATIEPIEVPESPDREVLFWQTVKDSDKPGDFEDYLKRWPKGTFAGIASRRRRDLEQQMTALVVPQEPKWTIREIDDVFIAVKRANLRAGPGTNFEKIGRLLSGDLVEVTGKVEGRAWMRVKMSDGRRAFVYEPLLAPESLLPSAKRPEAPEPTISTPNQTKAATQSSPSPKPVAEPQQTAKLTWESPDELRAWIRDTSNVALLETYLAQNPGDGYTTLVQQKIYALKAKKRLESQRAAVESIDPNGVWSGKIEIYETSPLRLINDCQLRVSIETGRFKQYFGCSRDSQSNSWVFQGSVREDGRLRSGTTLWTTTQQTVFQLQGTLSKFVATRKAKGGNKMYRIVGELLKAE